MPRRKCLHPLYIAKFKATEVFYIISDKWHILRQESLRCWGWSTKLCLFYPLVVCILTTRIKVCSHLTDSSPSFAQFNRLLLLLIKWTIKWTNWVETHSARYSAHHHLHNIKQKWPILIKQAKICYVWKSLTEAFGLPKPSLFCIVQRDGTFLLSYSKLNSNSNSYKVMWQYASFWLVVSYVLLCTFALLYNYFCACVNIVWTFTFMKELCTKQCPPSQYQQFNELSCNR